MAYLALYRKYRPSSFDEIVGQKAVVTALRNQIRFGCIGHAYLFCGTRGTGKTSVARVFAKAVNCLNPKDGNPCGECELCQEAESSFNIIEIDAASNNGVDSIRELRDEVVYTPVKGRYKVYIIDEVHMLTASAFNALLKTLEEPPEHVIFVLATTEPQKVMQTILSRCQRYDFKRLTVAEIRAQLEKVCLAEGFDAEKEALEYIAQTADGGMRDALSLLDQCRAYYMEETITLDKVEDMLGAVDNTVLGKMTRSLVAGDAVDILSELDRLYEQGRDALQFVNSWISYLRGVLLYRVLRQGAEAYVTERTMIREEMAALASEMKEDTISLYIREFSQLANRLKYTLQKRILLETGLITLCINGTQPEAANAAPTASAADPRLAERLDRLERKVTELAQTLRTAPKKSAREAASVRPAANTAETSAPVERKPEPAQPVSASAPAESFEDWDAIRKRVISRYRPLMILNFFDNPVREGDCYVLYTGSEIYRSQMEMNNNERLKALTEQVKDITGVSYTFRAAVK